MLIGTDTAPVRLAGGDLEIRFFGHADIRSAGVSLKFAKRSTTLAMLALIVLQRGRAISRESLAFTLFPEVDEAAALAELRRLLYTTSKSLPDTPDQPVVVVDAETVRFNPASAAFVDVLAFEQLSGSEQTQPQALALYTGDLLESIYDDWVLAERERLRTRYLGVLTESLERYRARRDFPAAIACATRMLATDAWREDTLRSLLAVRYESGDTAGALAEYERFAKRLRDELGIAPMAETIAVRQAILRNDVLPGVLDRAPHSADPPRQPAIAMLPFVGRGRELAALQAAWARAARGNAAFTLVRGEAGVGKTRLTLELARSVQSEGGRVFVGTTAAPESIPYQAIVEALRSGLPLLQTRPLAPARRAALARILPELRDSATADPVIADGPAERATARLYDALMHAVRGLAHPRPLLLVLEDLQWAGSATIEALGAIVRELNRAPILIVATCREEETPAHHPLCVLLRSLRAFPNVDELGLERLEAADVAQLVARVDGLPDRSARLAHDLYAQSEGNALFLNEAINGVLERHDAAPAELPAMSIARVIAARIAQLGESARRVAEIAAVAGSGCSIALVRDISNAAAAEVARGLDELLDRRIMRESSARSRHDYVFTHHLIARAIYDDIEPAIRAQRHSRIARVLETEHRETGVSSARELARHHERAGDRARSADWYLIAAREAAGVHAYGDAIELAGRALDNAPADELRIAALDVRERARGRRGDRAGQRADIDLLAALVGGDARASFDVLERRVLLARALGESDEEGRLIGTLTNAAEALDEGARAKALMHCATHAGLLSRQGDGVLPARAALAMYEHSGDLRGQLECLSLLVDFSTNIGDIEASRAYLALMRERAATSGDQVVEARALAVAAQAALLRAQYHECFELTTRALALHVATNDSEGEAASRGRLAVTAAWLTDFATALREFDRALAAFESIGHKRGVALTHTNRTLLLMRLGLFDDALLSIERSDALFATVHEQRMIVANAVNASFVKLQLGDAAVAQTLAHSALAAAREIGFPAFEAAALANLGNAERALGKFDAAITHMEAGIALRRPIQAVRDFVDDLADLILAYAAAGRNDEASALAHELRTLGATSFAGAFWPHYIWWAVGRGLGAGGAGSAARECAARARAELTEFAQRIEDKRARAAFLGVPINLVIARS